MNVTNETIMAKIATNKSLLKEFETAEGRTVYLKNGDEFQIQLYNPTDEEIAASIFIDGKELSNKIILRPAERIWLERYLDDPRKFKFNTYEVEDNVETEKAISKNGEIRVLFYKKSEPYKIKTIQYSQPTYYTIEPCVLGGSSICNTSSTATSITSALYNYSKPISATIKGIDAKIDTCCVNSISDNSGQLINCDNVDLSFGTTSCTANLSNTIETGRTGKGSYSSQTFEDVNMDFSLWSFHTEIIKILPMSRKPYTVNDLEKIYCTECGRKLKTKYKFCPYCGTKIE